MASTQAEVEAPRNGPEMKDLDGPNTNGVDAQREMETNSSNGPTSTPVSNNGSHDMNESSKLQSSGGYYKPPVGYPVDSPAAGYENAQSGFGYPPHSYIHQQQQQGELQQQGSYPYPQYPGSNLVRNVSSPVLATKPVAYMNSMPRPGVGPLPSYPPVHHGSGAAGGQGYPPSRYSTPTLNQLLQPGTGVPVQRYSYGDYPQQQPPPPNSHPAAGWPMQQQQPQQPRNFAPGFKPPPNSMQQVRSNVKVKPNFPRKTFFIRRMLCTLHHTALRSLAVSFILIAWLLETNNESSCFYITLGKVGNERIFQLVVDGRRPESTPTHPPLVGS